MQGVLGPAVNHFAVNHFAHFVLRGTLKLSGLMNNSGVTVNTTSSDSRSAAGGCLSRIGISDLGNDADKPAVMSEVDEDAVVREGHLHASNSMAEHDGKSSVHEIGDDANFAPSRKPSSSSTDMKNASPATESRTHASSVTSSNANDSMRVRQLYLEHNSGLSNISNISSILADGQSIYAASLSSSDHESVVSFLDDLGPFRCDATALSPNASAGSIGMGSIATLLETETASARDRNGNGNLHASVTTASPTSKSTHGASTSRGYDSNNNYTRSLDVQNGTNYVHINGTAALPKDNMVTRDTPADGNIDIQKKGGTEESAPSAENRSEGRACKDSDSDILMVCVSFGVRRWAEW
jgi:hypothetical protein